MEKKGWKRLTIVFIILTALMTAFVTAMVIIQNKKPKWNFEGTVTNGVVKIKFGRKTYEYSLNTVGKDFIIGTGRYTLNVYTNMDAAGTITGATGQVYDAKSGEPVDASVTINA